MVTKLEKIHPKFRQLTDLIFLSERTDINLSNYKSLLKLNQKHHLEYLFSQFEKSSGIFWENSPKLWAFRLSVIFSLKEKALTEKVKSYIERRFLHLLIVKSSPDPKYDNEFSQFIEYCKYHRNRRDSFNPIKEVYLKAIPTSSLEKIIKTTKHLTPYLFKDMNDFGSFIASHALSEWRFLPILKELKNHGHKYNSKLIFNRIKTVLFEGSSEANSNAIAYAILDDDLRLALKTEYKPIYKDKFLKFVEGCDLNLLEEKWLRNTINIIDIAPALSEDIAKIYINKLYQKNFGNKQAHSDRVVRLLTKCPQVSPKKVFVHLSNMGKLFDIKLLLRSFPELKKLLAFV